MSNVTTQVMYDQQGNRNMVQPLANVSLNVQANITGKCVNIACDTMSLTFTFLPVPYQWYSQLLLLRALWMFPLFQGFNNSMCLFNQPSTTTALLLSPLAPVKTIDPSERQQSVPVGSGSIAAIAIFHLLLSAPW